MRFHHELPKVNDERVVVRFAWLPEPVSDDEFVWLERYVAFQVYFYYTGWTTVDRKQR